MTNNKTSKELLTELVENYSSNNINTATNEELLTNVKKILDDFDNGSIFRYTIEEISFCGDCGNNTIIIVISGAKGQTFTKSEKFSITFNERNDASGKVYIVSSYGHRILRLEYSNFHRNFISNFIKFNMEIYEMKNQMAAIFENIESGVKNILEGTDFQIKWCDTANSKLMIADKDGEDFFLITGKCINNNGEIEVESSFCNGCGFDNFAAIEENIKKKDDYRVFDVFMATNNLCKKIAANE